MVWPETLTEEFARNLAVPNFGVRSAVIGVAAHEMGCTFGINASRARPAYIYIHAGFGDFGNQDILGNN